MAVLIWRRRPRYARALEPYDLKWYEEPGDPLDFDLNREVGLASSTPIATGENLFSMQDAPQSHPPTAA